MKKDLEFDALKKFWLTPPRVFDFETLRSLKYSGDTGYLLELQKLYAGMFQEWDTLKKDVGTLMAAVAALDWRVVPYVEKGEKPSAKAQKVADVVSRAIWAKHKQKPGTYAHSFLQMVGSMVDGLLRGVSVHELLLERLSDGTIAAPFYNMVFANYYIWENRDGKEDRLMLVRDGESFSDPEPFPENKFVIALNTQGSDHPMYNSVYSSLLGYFGAAKWGLPWLQEYCQRYGHDIKTFTVQTEEQERRLREQLAQADDITEVFLRAGEQMEVTPIPGAAGNPYETLMRLAENHCHQAILGQTLTSDTSENGGSRAQAEVHMGVQKDVVLHYAEYVASVLNAQLIPALVELNFGKGELPMPELQFSIPDGGVSLETANYWKAVLEIPGMRVAQEEIYESLRIPMPADGAAVFETPSAPAGFGGMMPHTHGTQTAPQGGKDKPQEGDDTNDDDDDTDPPGGGGGKPETDEGGDVDAARGEMSEQEKRLAEVDKMAAEGMRQWAAPTVAALQRMLDAGVPMASIRERLDEMMPDTDALADALTAVFRSSLGVDDGEVTAAQGKQFTDAEIQRYVDYYHASLSYEGNYFAGRFIRNPDIPDVPHDQVLEFLRRKRKNSANVDAANPFGCNQYGEGWAEPHEGNSTTNVPGAGKVATHVDENGNVTQKTAPKKPGEKDYTSDRKPIVTEEQQKKIDEGAKKAADSIPPFGVLQKAKGRPSFDDSVKNSPYGNAKTKKEAFENTKKLSAKASKSGSAKIAWHNDIPLDYINEYNATVDYMLQEYPGVNFDTMGSYIDRSSAGDSYLASCGYYTRRYGATSFRLNTDHTTGGIHDLSACKPYDRTTQEKELGYLKGELSKATAGSAEEKRIKKDIAEKEEEMKYTRYNVCAAPNGATVRAVLIHEWGHALHGPVDEAAIGGDGYSLAARNAVLNAFDKAKQNGDIYKISKYAASDYCEFFAECFSAHVLGEKLPDYMVNMIDIVHKRAQDKRNA